MNSARSQLAEQWSWSWILFTHYSTSIPVFASSASPHFHFRSIHVVLLSASCTTLRYTCPEKLNSPGPGKALSPYTKASGNTEAVVPSREPQHAMVGAARSKSRSSSNVAPLKARCVYNRPARVTYPLHFLIERAFRCMGLRVFSIVVAMLCWVSLISYFLQFPKLKLKTKKRCLLGSTGL